MTMSTFMPSVPNVPGKYIKKDGMSGTAAAAFTHWLLPIVPFWPLFAWWKGEKRRKSVIVSILFQRRGRFYGLGFSCPARGRTFFLLVGSRESPSKPTPAFRPLVKEVGHWGAYLAGPLSCQKEYCSLDGFPRRSWLQTYVRSERAEKTPDQLYEEEEDDDDDTNGP